VDKVTASLVDALAKAKQQETVDPYASADLGPLYKFLAEDPDVAYRGSILPMVRTKAGETRLGMPQMALDAGRGLVDLLAGVRTGQMSPEATQAIAGLATSSAMQPPQQGLLAAIKAYHGSPHRFDKFDMSKIGTGEGAQAYGHGLYFAESKGVADSYRDNLAFRDSMSNAAWNAPPVPKEDEASAKAAESVLRKFWGSWQPDEMLSKVKDNARQLDQSRKYLAQLEELERSARPELRERFPKIFADRQKEIESTKRGIADAEEALAALPALEKYGVDAFQRQPGSLYSVTLSPDHDDLLDWDAPLSQQSEKVKAALADAWLGHPEDDAGKTGAQIYHALLRTKKPEEVSAALRAAGIPGIRYLDAGSRGKGDGSRNIVLFDDSLVNIDEVR
jgi:hypothetical protein